jgi:hypothetical protein
MVIEARRDPAWEVLQSIPFFGPVRVSLLLATMKTPWRFRTKRNLWAYAGLAVVTESSADHEFIAGRPVRRRRKPLTRGLNKNHNRVLKDIFKSTRQRRSADPDPSRTSITGWFRAACVKTWHVSRWRGSSPHSRCGSGKQEKPTIRND